MTDPGTPPPPPQSAPAPSSVVVDERATVHVSKWPIWVAILAVVAFVGFTVVWFVTNEEDSYTPGPMAGAFLDGIDQQGFDVEVRDDALRCIDDNAGDLDPAVIFGDGSDLDPLASNVEPGSDESAFLGTMFDECLDHTERVALLTESLMTDAPEDVTREQGECIAGALDDAFVDAGGYSPIFEDPQAAMAVVFGMLGAFQDCGVDMSSLG